MGNDCSPNCECKGGTEHAFVSDDLWPIWLHATDVNAKVYCDPCGQDLIRADIDQAFTFDRAFVRDSGFDNTGTLWCDLCGYVVNPDAELRSDRRHG